MEKKRTALAAWHEAHDATMADFAGWSMPLWYPSGARNEHTAVITNAGLFDTSHMSFVTVSGPDAYDLLQLCFTRDLRACAGKGDAPLSSGTCVYGAFLNERGELIDDAIVYQLAEGEYLVIVNAGMGGTIAEHLKSCLQGRNARVDDLSGNVAKIDVQGPAAAKVLRKVLKTPERVFAKMPYFSFKGALGDDSAHDTVTLTGGTPVLVSRTGYTGEFGFEIIVSPDRLVRVWEMMLSAGEEFGAIACGLAARDSLRAGAVLPLSHQDIGPWPFINHPWHFALPFDSERKRFTKAFVGDAVLELRDRAEHTHAFAGYDPRKVSTHDPAVVLYSKGEEIGVVTTCVADLAIDRINDRICSIASPDRPKNFKPRGLCCGFVRVKPHLEVGQMVELKDKRRSIKAQIVEDIRPDRTARRPLQEFI
jgi:aminomethyltransferase